MSIHCRNKSDTVPMNADQARMARAAIKLGVREVAEVASITPNTVSRIENGSDAKVSTMDALETVYRERGISFLEDDGDGPGVRFKAGADSKTSGLSCGGGEK